MKKYKKDVVVILVLLIAASGFYLGLCLNRNNTAESVEVYREDTLIETYDLNKNGTYQIKEGENFNQIIIKDRNVSMEEADCPDKLCVKQGKISKSGETIICLPHKIVVKISSGGERIHE